MTEWAGHAGETQSALRALLERARAGDAEFTWSERALATACEFWAASMTHSLVEHLAPEPDCRLWLAEVAFTEIGLADLTSLLRVARGALVPPLDGSSLDALAVRLEAAMATLSPAVDAALAKYARAVTAGSDRLPTSAGLEP